MRSASAQVLRCGGASHATPVKSATAPRLSTTRRRSAATRADAPTRCRNVHEAEGGVLLSARMSASTCSPLRADGPRAQTNAEKSAREGNADGGNGRRTTSRTKTPHGSTPAPRTRGPARKYAVPSWSCDLRSVRPRARDVAAAFTLRSRVSKAYRLFQLTQRVLGSACCTAAMAADEPQEALDALLRASASGALEGCASAVAGCLFAVLSRDAPLCLRAASRLMPTPCTSRTARAFREIRC